MKRLNKYALESALMDITISYGNEKFEFNLFKELVIDENKIDSEIKEQPTSYAFLSMLHKKLIRVMSDKEREADKKYWALFLLFKSEIDKNTGKPISNDVAQAKARKDSGYQEKLKAYHTAELNCSIIEACVKGFEQRGSLIQTLSANIRKSH